MSPLVLPPSSLSAQGQRDVTSVFGAGLGVVGLDHVASAAMRLSEFWALIEQEFGGPYGRSVASGHVIHAMGDQTAVDAIESGEPVRRVWTALCEDLQIPEERRYRAERRPPRRS